jgi:hypothetical protein
MDNCYSNHFSRILGDVNPKECFWVHNGVGLRNLYELLDALKHMSDSTFGYHVNEEKNDFEKWVLEVIKDKELAKDIANVKNKEVMIKKIRGRIKYMENKVNVEKLKWLGIEDSGIIDEFTLHPKETIIYSIIIFLLGILIGVLIGVFIILL